jgi:hypothetical protein
MITPTTEQQFILDNQVSRACIQALAGTGKTTLFRLLAQSNPHLRFLYLTYNRSIADSANLPRNAVSLTGHQLAYKCVGKDYKRKFSNNLNTGLIKKKMNISWSESAIVKNTLDKFFLSDDDIIQFHHIALARKASHEESAKYIQLSSIIWESMKDLNGHFPMTHDGYLKYFTLKGVDLTENFDILLIDEAQDLNPCLKAFIRNQSDLRIYLCGDGSQQIYRYRGADNALGNFIEEENATTFSLTHSFRFNNSIAMYANSFLEQLGVSDRLTGINNGIRESILRNPTQLKDDYLCAYLNRTVLKTIEVAIENVNRRTFWVGGIQNYPFTDVFDVLHLLNGERGKIKNKNILRDYKSFNEYKDAAKDTKDLDMYRILKLVHKYENELFEIYDKLRSNSTNYIEDAEIILSTCHRAKGLEFHQVVLGDDFPSYNELSKRREIESIRDELNLMYVAITRSKFYCLTNEKFDSIFNRQHNIFKERKEQQSKPSKKKEPAERQKANLEKGLPQNHGLPWSEKDAQFVIEQYGANSSLIKIAKDRERKVSAIISLLKKQGVISEEEASSLALEYNSRTISIGSNEQAALSGRKDQKAKDKQKANLENGLPKNHGLPWSKEGIQFVIEQYSANSSLEQIAKDSARKVSAIIYLLKNQAVISAKEASSLALKYDSRIAPDRQ